MLRNKAFHLSGEICRRTPGRHLRCNLSIHFTGNTLIVRPHRQCLTDGSCWKAKAPSGCYWKPPWTWEVWSELILPTCSRATLSVTSTGLSLGQKILW